MRKALEDKKMVQKARESLKAWQERKRKEFNLLCYSLQGFIQIDNFQDIPLQDRGKFDYVTFGRKALVRPIDIRPSEAEIKWPEKYPI